MATRVPVLTILPVIRLVRLVRLVPVLRVLRVMSIGVKMRLLTVGTMGGKLTVKGLIGLVSVIRNRIILAVGLIDGITTIRPLLRVALVAWPALFALIVPVSRLF